MCDQSKDGRYEAEVTDEVLLISFYEIGQILLVRRPDGRTVFKETTDDV